MKAGVVTNAHAWDAKFVSANISAGGFAGEMKTGGVAEVGKVSLIGLDIAGSISAVQTFVPVIRNSDITGFQSGMTVKAIGIPVKDSTLKIEKSVTPEAVGHMLGGQIWGNWSEASTYGATDAVPDPNNKRCFVANLRKVEGTKTIEALPVRLTRQGSAAALDTAGSSGLLGGLLQSLIKTPGDLYPYLIQLFLQCAAQMLTPGISGALSLTALRCEWFRKYRLCKGGAGGFAGESMVRLSEK